MAKRMKANRAKGADEKRQQIDLTKNSQEEPEESYTLRFVLTPKEVIALLKTYRSDWPIDISNDADLCALFLKDDDGRLVLRVTYVTKQGLRESDIRFPLPGERGS